MRVRRILGFCVLLATVGVVLFSEFLVSHQAPDWLRSVAWEVQMAVRDAQTQWMVVVCLAIYFVTFLFIEQRLEGKRRWWRLDNPNVWLLGLIVIGALRYAFDYERASRATEFVGLVAGIVFGQGAMIWVRWPQDVGEKARRMLWLLGTFACLLAGVALWQPAGEGTFQYRGQPRWNGAWVNPNTYGLLMATGFVLALGLSVHRLRFRVQSPSLGIKRLAWAVSWGVGVSLCGIGLLKSYSRSAWLGALVGIGFLAYELAHGGRSSGRVAVWLRRNGRACVVVMVSLWLSAFWQFRDTQWRPARRAFSVGNINDFSWRNRLTTWEGALQMMANRPLVGFGWGRMHTAYAQLYCPPKLAESGAIGLNDFFTIGVSLGLPALLCFAVCIWLRLRRGMLAAIHEPDSAVPIELQKIGVLSSICRAGALVIFMGFWFAGGLFNLPLGPVFWALLLLGSMDASLQSVTVGNRLLLRPVVLCTLLALVTALVWATARDPFHRVTFSVRDETGIRTPCIAVMPKGTEALPVVIFAHGGGDSIETSGKMLRLIAEQGLAAVGFEYNKTNQAHFNAQMRALLAALPYQHWAQTNAVAWIGHSQGAQSMLGFLVGHPQLQPEVMVRLAGGWVNKLELLETNAVPGQLLSKMRVWLLHGEADEIFPVTDVKRLAAVLRASGAKVQFDVLPSWGHNFGPNHMVLMRAAAEYCAAQLGGAQPVHVNVRLVNLYYWIPAGLMWLAFFGSVFRRFSRDEIRPSRWLLLTAWMCGIFALSVTAFHFVILRLPATGNVLYVARHVVVPARLQNDFDWLAAHMAGMHTTVGEILEHVQLADLQRNSFTPAIDEASYRQWILSPLLDDSLKPTRWRRTLWENFCPRVRRGGNPSAAAETVVQHLRERVTVTDRDRPAESVSEIWRSQTTGRTGFEKIYVAALRSVGIPARVGQTGRAEILCDSTWTPAPRSVLEELEKWD